MWNLLKLFKKKRFHAFVTVSSGWREVNFGPFPFEAYMYLLW